MSDPIDENNDSLTTSNYDYSNKTVWPQEFGIYYTSPKAIRKPLQIFSSDSQDISDEKYTMEFRIQNLNDLYAEINYEIEMHGYEEALVTFGENTLNQCTAYGELIAVLNNHEDAHTTHYSRDIDSHQTIKNPTEAGEGSYYIFKASGTRNSQFIADQLLQRFSFEDKNLENDLRQIALGSDKKFRDANRTVPKSASNMQEYTRISLADKKPIVFIKTTELDQDYPKMFVFKPNNGRQHLSELETFSSSIHQLVTPDQFASATSVHDENNNVVGVMSEMWDDFISLRQFVLDERENDADFSINLALFKKFHLMPLFTLAATERDIDLHSDNYGPRSSGGPAVRFDGDRSTFTLAAKYFEVNANIGAHLITQTAANKIFPLTPSALKKFPALDNKIDPYHWYDRQNQKELALFSPNLTKEMTEDKEVQSEKWRTFLKRALIPNATFVDLAGKHFSNAKLAEAAARDKIHVSQQLQENLPQVATFREWFRKNKERCLQEIVKEFNVTAAKFGFTIDTEECKKICNDLDRKIGPSKTVSKTAMFISSPSTPATPSSPSEDHQPIEPFKSKRIK